MTSLFWNRNRLWNDLFAFAREIFRKCQHPAPHLIQLTPFRILGLKDSSLRIALFVGLVLIVSGLPAAAAPDRPDRQPESTLAKQHISALMTATPTISLRSGRFSPIGSLPRNLSALRAASNSQEPIHVLVQFDQIPDAASRRALRARGLDLLGYLPSNAFVAKVSYRTSPEDLARNHVKWIGGFYPEDKLPTRIASSGIGAWAVRPDGSADLRVKCHKDVPIERAGRELQKTGARIVASDGTLSEITVNVAPEIVDSLSQLDCVRWIEEVPPPPINWNDGTRPNVQADLVQAAPYNLTGAGVTVGIWDAGDVDASHGDLAGRVTLAESTGTPSQHSTHVAGILAGDGTLSVAAGGQDRQWRGIATSAKIVSFNNANPIPKHQLAIDQYDVILSQNSWGVRLIEFLGNCGLYGTYSSLSPEYDQLVTGLYGRRLNVIFAAGNLRNGLDINSCGVGPYGTIGPPSTAKDILCVGAIASDDNSMPVFSSWGPTEDGRLKPDLVAPGAQVTGDHGITSTSPGGTYAVLQGTSMSAPVISGATALLVENHRSLYSGQNPLPSTIKGLLIHTAADLGDGAPWYQRGPDYASGYGRVQIKDAVDQLRGGGFLIGEVDHGAVSSYRLKIPEGAGEVRLTLVWDDPAGLENAATALVNDLDLVVFDPDGVRHYPWTLDPVRPDAPAVRTAEDHLNVIEQVVVDPPVGAGDWTVQVVGYNVPVDAPQKFTLLFSPMSIPAPSILLLDQATLSEDPNGAANGNGYIDPGETILANVVFRNTDGPTASNVTATISTDAGGITLLQAESPYPDLTPGGTGTNIVPFSFRVSKTFPCGTTIPFQHVVSYGEFQVTNFFTAVVGYLTVTNQSTNRFVSVDVPKDIPDDGLVISTNSIATPGLVRDLDVSVRIDHTWYGDLQLELENPDGTSVRLVSATGNYGQNLGQGDCSQPELHTTFDDAAAEPFSDGVAPFVGSFRPEEALAGLDNKPLEGDWQLWVADQAINDTGTLLCWSMNVAYDQQGYVCTLFNRAPVVSGLDVNVYRDTPKVIAFTTVDPDDDPLEFRLTALPVNGTLSLFETNTGHCIYSPTPGYSGPDSFSVQISDGYTNVTAAVTITVLPPLTDLAVTETIAPNPVGVNQSVTISLVVTNQGPNGATGLILTNLLPERLVFESAVASQGSSSNSGNIVVCDLGDLSAASGAQVTIIAQAIETGLMTNAVSVNAVEDDLDSANNSTTAVVDVKLTTDLTVISRAVPETVLYGQATDFQTMVTNYGPSVATQLQVTDILPPGFDLLGVEVDQGSWTNNGGLVIWQPGDLAPGESVTAHVHARGGLLGAATNVVTVSEDEVDLNPGDNHAEADVVVVPSADLAVGMQAYPTVTAIGQELRYDIGVTNNGPNIALGVTLEDLLPTPSELVSVDLPQGSWTNQAGDLSFTLGDLEPGTNLLVSVRIHPIALGFLTNVVNVAAVESDVDPSNNLAQTITEVRPMADVQLGIASFNSSILLGRDAVIEFGITNAGPGVAHRVSLQYPLVEGIQLKSFDASQGSATNVDGTLTFDLGDLDAAANASVQIVVKPLVTGTLAGRASAVAEEVDPDLSNNQVDVIWNMMPAVDLQVSQNTQPNPALLGQDIQFEIEVTNQGPSGASDLQLADLLPTGTQLIDVVMSQGTFTNSNGVLTGYLGDLPVGGVADLTLTLRADQLGMITNDVTASAREQEVAPEDNLAEAVVLIQPAADLKLSLQATPQVGILGQLVTYQLIVTNLGPNVANLVRLEDTLPVNGNVTQVQVSNGSWTNLTGQIVADFGSLDVGGVASLQVVISPAGVGEMTNSAIVSAIEGDINPTNNVASLITPVRLDADLAIGITAGSTSVFVDNKLSFTLSVTNLGPNIAQNIQVEDDLPPGSTIVDVEPSQGTWTNSTGRVEWTPGDLPPGSAATATLIIRAGVTGGNTNTVTVVSDEVDPDPSNNTAASVIAVLPAVDLAISQQSLPMPGLLGQELAFLLTVTNLGPSVAHTVQVEDTLPVGIGLLRIETSLGSWTNASGTVTWNAGDLQPNDVARLSLVFHADQLGIFTNTTSVQANEADEDLLDNLSQAVVTVVPAIDLAVAQQVHPVVAAVIEAVIYDLSVTNSGPSDATDVVLQNLLPDGVIVLDVESSNGDWTNVNGTVTFRFGNLTVGAAATAQITLAANSPGILTNSVSVAADQSEVRPEDNQSSITSVVKIEAGLAVSIAPPDTAPVVNRDFGYELSVTNQGPGEATGVVLTDDLDAQAELVSVDLSQGTWTVIGQTVRCDLGPLAADGSVSATIVVRPLSPGNLTNTTSVVADVLDRDLSDNSAQRVDTVYPPASLRIAQAASADSVLVNDHLDYQITVFNDTLYAVPQLVLADQLPAGAELTSSSTTYGTITNDQTTLTLDLSGLVPGSNAVLTITITPQIVGTITNEASLLSPYVDSANTNLVSRITTKVIATPTLEFEHSSNHLIFSWPQVAGNYTIESTDQLGANASWSEVQNPQVIVDGRVTVTIKIFGEARFYRLTKF